MTTVLLSTSPSDIAQAAAYLCEGQVAVFPTDTVYGIGASAFDEQAIADLYEAKARPMEKGIPILLSDREVLEKVTSYVPPVAQQLIDQYWPGPLTLLVAKHPSLPANVSPNDKIAVRMPEHEAARTLIRLAGGAIATTSANISNEEPALNASEAMAYFADKVAVVVDGGTSRHALSSTIVDCTVSPLRILREGPISSASLALEPA